MSAKRIFYLDYNETRQMLRREVETDIEATLEEERRDGYASGAMQFGEDVSLLTNSQKEDLRVQSLKDLELCRTTINMLLNKFIDRSAWFMVSYDLAERVWTVAAILALIFGDYLLAFVLAVFVATLFFVSKINVVYLNLEYILTGCGGIMDELLVEYNKYGRIEAALFFADYRGLSKQDHSKWIFTPSHVSERDEKDP